MNNVIISKDMEKTTERLVDYIYTLIESLLKTQSRVTIGLSGAAMVPLLTNEMVKRKVHFKPFANQLFFLACDERFVPLDHVDSNFGEYIARNLFKELGVPTENLFPINYEGTVEQCARDYDRRLRPFLNKHNGFDILLVGAGPDGHTCSLFPGHDLFVNAAKITDLVVSISDSPKPPSQRVTLALNYINNSKHLLFLCGRDSNAETIKRILIDKDPSLPCTAIKSNQSNGEVKWFIDEEAAALL